jgi:hypothetical protein
MVHLVGAKLRENIRKETMASMKNVAPSKIELVINATEPAVVKYIELVSELFGAMCTPSQAPEDELAEPDFVAIEREIARTREAVELKAEQVRILRDQVLAVLDK